MFSDLITKGENKTNKKQRGPKGTFRGNGYLYDADGNAGFTRIYLSPGEAPGKGELQPPRSPDPQQCRRQAGQLTGTKTRYWAPSGTWPPAAASSRPYRT